VLVDEWMRAGVSDVVACPGSRSTPVLVALAEASERGALRLHLMLDERAAGFFALGLALARGMPAPVVTTSGTAAVELHPAVVEAHHAGVPMVVVTADRPEELQDCGAPQTVNQVGLYGRCVRWEAALGVPQLAGALSWRSLASRSVAEACGGAHRPGPVHLNLAFREPLLGRSETVLGPPAPPGPLSEARPEGIGAGGAGAERVGAGGNEDLGTLGAARGGRADGAPWHRFAPAEEVQPPKDVVEALAGVGDKGLIVAGAGAGERDPGAVWRLAKATSWPVLADPLSGCRWPGAIASADALLRCSNVRSWQPDAVLRLGRPWASRVLNEWLSTLQCPQFLVDPWGTWAAPDRLPGAVVAAGPGALCRAVARAVTARPAGAWSRQWSLAENVAQGAIDTALAAEDGLTEPGIARALLRAAPQGSTVVVSSSMPVRDLEWWSRPRDGVRVVANRGANGIDGVLSTALGVAAAGLPDRVIALLGDLAFLYDAGALLGAARRDVDLDVIVADNNGGGIFSFLPQASVQPRERFERLWGAPHDTDLVSLASGYGVAATEVPDLGSLVRAVSERDHIHIRGLRVLVAKTSRGVGVAVHERLHAALRRAVAGVAGGEAVGGAPARARAPVPARVRAAGVGVGTGEAAAVVASDPGNT
jgi:2-succinyl-5-enolpyruvyl-6-hydroxy-3-cyclohexene-1-carboxylate synthase